jgi:uncharacterized protein
VAHRHAATPGELDVSEQRYEVMYFLDLPDERIRDFKEHWGAIGDSIVVVGGDGLWNCHVHTNEIGAAIEVALELGGRPKSIRVSDLFEESRRRARQARGRAGLDGAGRPGRRRTPCGHHRRGGGVFGQAAWSSCSRSSACRAWSPVARR